MVCFICVSIHVLILLIKIYDHHIYDDHKYDDHYDHHIYDHHKYDDHNEVLTIVGIWIRDIRFKCNLPMTQVNKVLKSLESKKLIKSVTSVGVYPNLNVFLFI